jgi:hypothetical protein
LGSFFAGIKAGTLGGIVYVGGMAVFNVALLYALKPQVLDLITSQYSSICATTAGNSTGSIESCFQSVVSVDVPYIAFVAFFIALIYSGLFGMFFDSLPAKASTWKGETFAGIIGVNLVFFGFSGFYFDSTSAAATSAFVVAWTVVFGYLLGRLYKKYTRAVEIASQDEGLLKVFVDGRDYTGKTRTFATTSNHKVRAELANDASFKEWETSGGVALEDARSFETVMEVNGNGTIKGKVGAKY